MDNIRAAVETSSPPYSSVMREYAGIISTFLLQMYAFQDISLNIKLIVNLPSLFTDHALVGETVNVFNHGLIGAVLPAIFAPTVSDAESLELRPGDRVLNDNTIQLLCQIFYPGTMDGRYYRDRSRYIKVVKVMVKRLSSRQVRI